MGSSRTPGSSSHYGPFLCAPRAGGHWSHLRAVGRGEGRVKFFCWLNSLTEQILVEGGSGARNAQGDHPLSNTYTGDIETEARPSAAGVSTEQVSTLQSPSQRRAHGLVPLKAQESRVSCWCPGPRLWPSGTWLFWSSCLPGLRALLMPREGNEERGSLRGRKSLLG